MAASKALLSILVLLFMPVSFCAGGRLILVGGKKGSWKIPASSNDTLSRWAGKSRFKVGDILVWKYDGKRDSVLEVSKEDYERCDTSKPMREHRDGETKIELHKSGPFYFISGAQGHCEKGQKLIVVVLSAHHRRASRGEPMAPAPAPPPDVAKSGGWRRVAGGFFVANVIVWISGFLLA